VKSSALVETDVARGSTCYDMHAWATGRCRMRTEGFDQPGADTTATPIRIQIDMQMRRIVLCQTGEGCKVADVREQGLVRGIVEAPGEIADDAPLRTEREKEMLAIAVEISAEPALVKGGALPLICELLGVAGGEEDGVDLRQLCRIDRAASLTLQALQ